MNAIFGIEVCPKLSHDIADASKSKEIQVVTEDGAPTGPKEFLVWNPPFVDQQQPKAGRLSAFSQTTALMRFLMKKGVRTIVFCKVSPSPCWGKRLNVQKDPQNL